jgi:hypothetical protein
MFSFARMYIAPRKTSRRTQGACPAARRARPRLEALEARVVLDSDSGAATPYLQTNLVSDISGLAQLPDSSLVNPWGVSFSNTSPFWVSNQGTDTSTLYQVTPTGISKLGLTVAIPTTGSGPQGPTGQVSNDTSSFLVNGSPAFFIFANLNGTISAWNQSAGKTAQIKATTPVPFTPVWPSRRTPPALSSTPPTTQTVASTFSMERSRRTASEPVHSSTPNCPPDSSRSTSS